MSEAKRLLELIEEGIVQHGGDLGGWTRRTEDTLQLFDGRVTLRAELKDNKPSSAIAVVHVHVFTTLHEHDDEVLEACLMGIGEDPHAALGQAAGTWITGVAGPIKSFMDNRPVCTTCQAGVEGRDASAGHTGGDYGLPGLRAYVGPWISRFFTDEDDLSAFDAAEPWFRFAAEAAAPRRVHLAKACLTSNGKDGWRRDLEVDGHDVSHRDPHWPVGAEASEFGYLTRFAVFEFPRDSGELRLRAELERTIRHFAENFSRYGCVDDLMEEMLRQGFVPDLVYETELFSTIAFGRVFFEHTGVQYSPTVIRARRDGRVETDVPLMSIPAYCRGSALAAQLRKTMPKDDFQSLCLYNAESHAIANALETMGDKPDLTGTEMYPCVVPDRDVSDQTMNAALAMLNRLANPGGSP